MYKSYYLCIMDTSSSGIISSEFVNVSDTFSDYTDISQSNHNRIVKAKRFGKWYVLKGLKPECADKAVFIELLRKEFDLGISLDHSNIVRTIGKERDSYIGDCIILEYIDGVTLKEWLKSKPTKSEKHRVVIQLLDAMGYFHAKGIIHRDMKPENILITRNGSNVKVIDFGLSDSDEYAILKQPAGNRKYSAPEQSDKNGKVDIRADIYALGHILREFKLGGVYNKIIHKATQQNCDSRFANSKEIIAAIESRRKLNIAMVILFVILFIGSGVLGIVQLKNAGEDNSTNIARIEWENAKLSSAKHGIEELFAPMVEIAKTSKTKAEAYKRNELYSKSKEINKNYTSLIENLLKDIPKESDFYFDFETKVAIMMGNYYKEFTTLVDRLPDE